MDLFHSIEFTFSKLEKEKGARLFLFAVGERLLTWGEEAKGYHQR